MQVIHRISELHERLATEPAIGFVPTMGNLHEGHLALVSIARARSRCTVASIFVNRLQFEPGGDFERYPRTLERDCALLEKAGCDVVFAPDEREMYPAAQEIFVTPPKAAEPLEGAFRRGHFQGVCTVVTKLFHAVQPDIAVFGKKDYQQLNVIRALVKQLNFPVEIVAGETVREADGLAMSSRNNYLSSEERAEAPRLQRSLQRVRQAAAAGARDFAALASKAADDLRQAGWKVDYVAVRNRVDLAPPEPDDRELVVLGAAWLGKTRLIDNVELEG
ncbi:MAG TPA: pantoate--beta-alanine ligase [Usitatibacter sp.]|nr:pantoate--beta-alanine ligase [Usitatibacter sp.]